jgi:hypothetical protein
MERVRWLTIPSLLLPSASLVALDPQSATQQLSLKEVRPSADTLKVKLNRGIQDR